LEELRGVSVTDDGALKGKSYDFLVNLANAL
jgi:hypothetical protein